MGSRKNKPTGDLNKKPLPAAMDANPTRPSLFPELPVHGLDSIDLTGRDWIWTKLDQTRPDWTDGADANTDLNLDVTFGESLAAPAFRFSGGRTSQLMVERRANNRDGLKRVQVVGF